MSHIEDPTIKTNAPTSLLKALGEAHLSAGFLLFKLNGDKRTDTGQAPNGVVDYARDTRSLIIQADDAISPLAKNASEALYLAADIEDLADNIEVTLTGTNGPKVGVAAAENRDLNSVVHDLPAVLTDVRDRLTKILAAVGAAERNEDGTLIRHT